ncbi:MAG: hypothetical protein NPIRA06_12290 [Nitrospirales bacterium]|nr:MAG: hypothetical protein NPIRA06_12290 [Nitrospirales bacterium]
MPDENSGNHGISKEASNLSVLFSAFILASSGKLAIPDTESLLLPSFRWSEIIGFVAGLGTTVAALPDLIGMLKRRSSKGMNQRMAAIMHAFQILWVYYGLLIVSRPVILWNIIAVATNFISVGAYYYYARRDGGYIRAAASLSG